MRALTPVATTSISVEDLEEALTTSFTVPTGVYKAAVVNAYFSQSEFSQDEGGQPGTLHVDFKVNGKNVSTDFNYQRWDKSKKDYTSLDQNGKPIAGYKKAMSFLLFTYGLSMEDAMNAASSNQKVHSSYGKEIKRPTINTPKGKTVMIAITEVLKNKNRQSNEHVVRNNVIACFDAAGGSLAEVKRGDKSQTYLNKFNEKYPEGVQLNELRTGTGSAAPAKATGTGTAVPPVAAAPAPAFDDFDDD